MKNLRDFIFECCRFRLICVILWLENKGMNKKRRFITWIIVSLTAVLSWIGLSAHARYDESRYELLKRLSIRELYEKGRESQDPDSTLTFLTVAINKHRESPSEEEKVYYVKVLNAMASTYFVKFNDFYNAYYYYLEASKEAESLDDYNLKAMLDYNMASVYTSIGEIDKAFACYADALDVSSRNKDWFIYLMAFSGFVLNSVTEGRLDSIDSELSRFASLEIPDTTMKSYSVCLYDGAKSLREGDYASAIKHFENSGNHIDTRFASEMYADFPSILAAHVYALKGDTANVIALTRSKLERYTPDNRAESYKWLSDLYRQMGKTDLSEHCLLAYYLVADSCGALKRNEDLTRATVSVNLRQLQDDLAEEAERVRRVKTLAGYATIWSLILLVLLVLLYRANRNLKRSKRNLYTQLRKLSELDGKKEVTEITSVVVDSSDKIPETNDTDNSKESSVSDKDPGPSPDESLRSLGEKIEEIMTTSSDIYRQDFSIGTVAAMLGEHPHKISKVINNVLGKRFNTWLSELRIEEACRRLADTEKYGHLTISAVAEELGYKSRTHFAGVFKKQTGLSPIEYQKFAMEEKRQ